MSLAVCTQLKEDPPVKASIYILYFGPGVDTIGAINIKTTCQKTMSCIIKIFLDLQLAEACCIPRLKAPKMLFKRREKTFIFSVRFGKHPLVTNDILHATADMQPN